MNEAAKQFPLETPEQNEFSATESANHGGAFDVLSTEIKQRWLPLLRVVENMHTSEFSLWLDELCNNNSIVNMSDGQLDNTLAFIASEAVQHGLEPGSEIFTRLDTNEDEDGVSVQARVLESMIRVADTNKRAEYDVARVQAAVTEALTYVSEHSQQFSPRALWDAVLTAEASQNIPVGVKQQLYLGLEYSLPYSEGHLEELRSRLDLADGSKFNSVIHLLGVTKHVEQNQSYSESDVHALFDSLYQGVEINDESNYLLATILKRLADNSPERYSAESEYDPVPEKISKDWYVSTAAGKASFANVRVSEQIELEKESARNIVKAFRVLHEGADHLTDEVDWETIPEGDLFSAHQSYISGLRDWCVYTTEDVFEKEGVSADKEIQTNYEILLQKPVRRTIESDFSVPLAELTTREQLHLLSYLRKTTVGSSETVRKFTSLYGVDGMRTFLSLEQGDESLGDHIVAFGQHDEVAHTVFKYYGELLTQADQIEDEGVRERVLARAQTDLETAVRAHDPASIAKRLHTYVAEAKVEVALIQEGIKKPLSATITKELAPDLPERMQDISIRNYAKESPEFQELMRDGMIAKFNEPNRRWYVDQTDSDEIIFFDSFTDVPYGETGEVQYKKFEAVNLGDDKYGGAGAARLKQTLDAELADGLPMQAFSDPENPVSQLYIEHGFVAVGTVSPTGKFSFELWRNSESSELLHTKQLSTSELIAQIESSEETSRFTIREVENGDRFPELKDGQCLTRYFKYNGQQYAVFEPVPAELQNGFVLPQEAQKEVV